ncbi:MAG: Ig-like domain-containing protein [Bacteroidota bacterium]
MKNTPLGSFRHYIFLSLIILSFSFYVSSCKKNTGPSEPVITLLSPADTTVINSGDTVLIEGTVTDNKSIHELYFTFRNSVTDSTILYDHPYAHGAKSYNFRYIWYPSSADPYVFSVDVQDHDKNQVFKDFTLNVN